MQQNKSFYTVSDFEAGRKMAEVFGAVVEVLECSQKAHGCSLIVKFKGASLLRVSTAETDVYNTTEKKRRHPSWLKVGTEVKDLKNGKTYLIEGVGNCRVLLCHYCDIDIRTLLTEFVPSAQQPVVAAWIQEGTKCKHDHFNCEVLAIEGGLAKIRKDWGCDTFTTGYVPASELAPMSTTITAINQATGDRTEVAVFVNDFAPEYNMLSLYMQLHNISNIWDQSLREKYADKVQKSKSGRSWLFEFDGMDYITRAY